MDILVSIPTFKELVLFVGGCGIGIFLIVLINTITVLLRNKNSVSYSSRCFKDR